MKRKKIAQDYTPLCNLSTGVNKDFPYFSSEKPRFSGYSMATEAECSYVSYGPVSYGPVSYGPFIFFSCEARLTADKWRVSCLMTACTAPKPCDCGAPLFRLSESAVFLGWLASQDGHVKWTLDTFWRKIIVNGARGILNSWGLFHYCTFHESSLAFSRDSEIRECSLTVSHHTKASPILKQTQPENAHTPKERRGNK